MAPLATSTGMPGTPLCRTRRGLRPPIDPEDTRHRRVRSARRAGRPQPTADASSWIMTSPPASQISCAPSKPSEPIPVITTARTLRMAVAHRAKQHIDRRAAGVLAWTLIGDADAASAPLGHLHGNLPARSRRTREREGRRHSPQLRGWRSGKKSALPTGG